jgi:hypothetical protein
VRGSQLTNGAYTGLAPHHHLAAAFADWIPRVLRLGVTGLGFLTVGTILRKMEQMEISGAAIVGIWAISALLTKTQCTHFRVV